MSIGVSSLGLYSVSTLESVSSSTQSYSYTASGGVTFVGAGTVVNGEVYTATGGVSFAGHGTVVYGGGRTASGGAAFAGTSSTVRSWGYVPVGGVIFSGHATYSNSGTATRTLSWNPRFRPQLWKSNQSWKGF